MALLAICLACSTFMFFVLLFRGALAPFTTGRGSNDPKGETRSEDIGVFRSEQAARVSATAFRGASRASGDLRRKRLHAGTRNFIAAKRGKRTNSSAHWLGAALLVPRAGALEMVKADCTLAQIALHFGVSESFCEGRIRQSGIDKQIERWRRCWRD